MNIMELGAIGELVGGVAVIGSLIFVGLQMRQYNLNLEANSRAVTASSEIAGGGQILQCQLPVAESAELAEILAAGGADYEKLSPPAKIRFSAFWSGVLGAHQGFFFHHKRGYISDETWDSYARQVDTGARQRGFRQWWEHSGKLFHPSFQAYIEAKRNDIEPEA